MAMVITENWRERSYQKGKGATRVFVISGVDDEEAARAALAAGQAPVEPITLDTEHPLDNRLKALEPTIRLTAPLSRGYTATVQYTRPANGTQDNDPTDPLDKEPEILPEFLDDQEPFDVDTNGNPVITGAGNPFDANPTRPGGGILLTYKRNESSYDLAKAMQYRNTVNNANFSFPHVGSVTIGQAACLGIRLFQGFQPSSNYVIVVYLFELRREGHRTRMLNQDYTGWYDDGGTQKRGKFVTSNGYDVSRPVLIDIDGVPYNTDIKVLGPGGAIVAPVARPLSVGTFFNADTSYFETTSSPATFLKYPKFTPISFNGLDLA